MFKKVLIAEDHESSNISVRKSLADLGIDQPTYAYYCDDALREIRQALQEKDPFELLVTDLSFDPDSREQNLKSGEELIAAARALQPGLKVLVFSFEKRPAVIDALSKEAGINGYVFKGRFDAQELKAAIVSLAENRRHFPSSLRETAEQRRTHDFTSYDLHLVRQLAKGTPQKDIPAYLTAHNIKPASLSSVEKRLNLIRENLNFSSNDQILLFCKEMGWI